jgi:outer membrane protein assembly factor BamB
LIEAPAIGSGISELLAGDADSVRACGYSASPLAYEDLIITTAGGTGRGVVAVQAASGKIVWQSQDFQNGYSSPVLIELDGRPEVVVLTYGVVSGLNPRT